MGKTVIDDWRPKAKEIRDFHVEKQTQLGPAKSGRPDSVLGKQGWGVRDTADYFGLNLRYVIEDLKLAEVIDDPRFNNLDRNEALEKLDGKVRASREGILFRGLVLALAKINTPTLTLKNVSEIKTILQETLKTYESRNPRGSKKDVR